MEQKSIFSNVIKKAYLISDSPRKAFYHMWIELQQDQYCLLKESGANGKVLDSRSWCFSKKEEAEKLIQKLDRLGFQSVAA